MQYPFLTAVKQTFDQTAEKSSGKVFWRLDIYVRGKSSLAHVNSTIGDPVQSWELLKSNLINQYTFGGVRQFDIHFKQSPTDPEGKLFPLDLTNEQALKAMSAKPVGIAGLEGTGLEAFGIGGIGSIISLMNEKHLAETKAEIAAMTHRHEIEMLKNNRSAGDRFFGLLEQWLDKPGVGEKLVEKLNFGGEVAVAGGERRTDNTAASQDGGVDFNPLIEGRMREIGVAAAGWGLDYNPAIEATLILKGTPMIDNPGELLKGVAQFIKDNPTEAMRLWSQMQQGQNGATA